jgi:hypothetical protein
MIPAANSGNRRAGTSRISGVPSGGVAFTEKLPPRFWSIREREAQMRRKLIEEYESGGS